MPSSAWLRGKRYHIRRTRRSGSCDLRAPVNNVREAPATFPDPSKVSVAPESSGFWTRVSSLGAVVGPRPIARISPERQGFPRRPCRSGRAPDRTGSSGPREGCPTWYSNENVARRIRSAVASLIDLIIEADNVPLATATQDSALDLLESMSGLSLATKRRVVARIGEHCKRC